MTNFVPAERCIMAEHQPRIARNANIKLEIRRSRASAHIQNSERVLSAESVDARVPNLKRESGRAPRCPSSSGLAISPRLQSATARPTRGPRRCVVAQASRCEPPAKLRSVCFTMSFSRCYTIFPAIHEAHCHPRLDRIHRQEHAANRRSVPRSLLGRESRSRQQRGVGFRAGTALAS